MNCTSHYFLDTENISVKYFISKLKKGFNIEKHAQLFLYFNRKMNCTVEEYDYLKSVFTDLVIESVDFSTPNALDFYLVTTISTFATKCQGQKIFLVSDDKGFEPMFVYLKNHFSSNKYFKIGEIDFELNQNSSISESKIIENTKIERYIKIGKQVALKSEVDAKRRIASEIIRKSIPGAFSKALSNIFVTVYYISQSEIDLENYKQIISEKYKIDWWTVNVIFKAIQ